jgi:hypothetical protein
MFDWWDANFLYGPGLSKKYFDQTLMKIKKVVVGAG